VASGAWVSKVDHRATTEHVLRLGEALCARAGAGDAGGARGSSGRRRGDVDEVGAASMGSGKAAARQGRTRGSPRSGSRAVGHGIWPE
jgi:hypothetical protein